MFFAKKKSDDYFDFGVELNKLIDRATDAGTDLLMIADRLSACADSLRARDAICRPHPSIGAPMTRIEEKLTAAQQEALRKEALGIED